MNIYKSIEKYGSMLFGAATPSKLKTTVTDNHYKGMDVPNADPIVEVKGIEGYRKMGRDAEVIAGMDLRLSAMIPGLQILPADIDEDAMAAADFINSIMKSMEGDLETTFRDQMLDEAIRTGFMVAEPDQAIIELPDYGKVIGLRSILVRPSEGFTDGIKIDSDGYVEVFHQMTLEGPKTAYPKDVLYYAYKGQPWNPYGRSVLHGAYDYFLLKQEFMRLYADFLTVNASGIKIYDIPDDDFQRDKASALDRLKRLAGRASIVKKLSHKLDIQIPPGTAGYQYIRAIKELCNVEIRKSILYDELINAEGVRTGSRSAREVSENVMYSVMATQGKAFCTAMAEQLFRPLLDVNGFTNWPTPRLVPEATPKRDADPAPILREYTAAVVAGVLPKPGVEEAKQISRQLLRPMGVDIVEDAPDEAETEDAEAREHIDFAAAPPGRRKSDTLKQNKEARKAEVQGVDNLTAAWKDNLPALEKSLNNALFDASGNWKSKDYGTVRKAVEDSITTGRSKIRKVMTDDLTVRYKAGREDAERMIKVQAAVSVVPVMITPTAAAKMLNQNVYLTMGKRYQDMTGDIYHILQRAINGGISERVAMASIESYLLEKGLPPGRATTIVNTSLGQAYNQGRMSLFSQLSDPNGTTPGGIIGYHYSAVMDGVTTEICKLYNGHNFRVNDPNVPTELLHYGCRRTLQPIFTGEEPWNGKGWTSLEQSAQMLAQAQQMPGAF